MVPRHICVILCQERWTSSIIESQEIVNLSSKHGNLHMRRTSIFQWGISC